MSDDLKEKLKTEIEQADWDMLRAHHEKGAVFIVGSKLELLDVGVALAKDSTSQVKIWLDNGDLVSPSQELIDTFEKAPFEKICHFIIIQPFVLIQLFD